MQKCAGEDAELVCLFSAVALQKQADSASLLVLCCSTQALNCRRIEITARGTEVTSRTEVQIEADVGRIWGVSVGAEVSQ